MSQQEIHLFPHRARPALSQFKSSLKYLRAAGRRYFQNNLRLVRQSLMRTHGRQGHGHRRQGRKGRKLNRYKASAVSIITIPAKYYARAI